MATKQTDKATTTQTNETSKTDSPPAQSQTRVTWNTANLKSSYANVCSVTSTREEVVLNFGINQAWERDRSEMQIELTDRIILSPFAAERLLKMLGNLMEEYQNRYGTLQPDVNAEGPTTRQ